MRAARERREAEAAKELANRGANLEETDRLVLAERVARRQRPLDEEDVRQRSRVRWVARSADLCATEPPPSL